jgi:2-methylisocitrate lyase-like PEP mutase family enzyme
MSATRQRGPPARRVVPVPPDGLDEIEAAVMASEAPAVIILDRTSIRLLLRYVRALERARDEGSDG